MGRKVRKVPVRVSAALIGGALVLGGCSSAPDPVQIIKDWAAVACGDALQMIGVGEGAAVRSSKCTVPTANGEDQQYIEVFTSSADARARVQEVRCPPLWVAGAHWVASTGIPEVAKRLQDELDADPAC